MRSSTQVKAQKPARPADVVDRVYEAIKELAVEYRFKPGERVNEVELAARLGCSRTPVRESLNRLVRDGFMTFVPNKGFYSRELAPESVQALYELRASIERGAFRWACQPGSDKEIAAAAAVWTNSGGKLDDMSAVDWTQVAKADEAFHLAIVELSQNSEMIRAIGEINDRIRFFRVIDLESKRRRGSTYDEHAAIIDALTRRDEDVGGALIERHIIMSSAHAVEVTKEGLARIFFGRTG